MSGLNDKTKFEHFCGEVEVVLAGRDPSEINDRRLIQEGQKYLEEFRQTHQPEPYTVRKIGDNALTNSLFPPGFKR